MKRRLEIASLVVGLLVVLGGGVTWLTTHAVRAAELVSTVESHSTELETLGSQVRALGVLQIQQGDEQRSILLDLAGDPGRPKPPHLLEAERRVLAP